MKTLAQIAYEAIGPSAPTWDLMYEEDQRRWEKVGDAVVTEYEARRWRPIEKCEFCDDGTEWLTYRSVGLQAVAIYSEPDNRWICTDGAILLNVTHIATLPAPPKEEEHGA